MRWSLSRLCAGLVALGGCLMWIGCRTPSAPAGAVPQAARAFKIRPTALVLEPVGPVSGARAGLREREPGYLQVYSATEAQEVGGITYHVHTPYVIETAEGKHVQGVPNRVGLMDQSPTTIRLPPGRYVVYARAEGYGRLAVPVLIVSSRLTLVWLRTPGLPEADAVPATELVRLPNGLPVGRRARLGPD